MTELMRTAEVLANYSDGDEHGWPEEFAWLRTNRAHELSELQTSIRQIGMVQPIVLGKDGRIWDGHHRLCIAHDSNFTWVPVIHSDDVPPLPLPPFNKDA